ncbi:MAG: hypothetical protein J6S56_04880 [Bacteroidales bacterium]|nr:hypothetical protein [Bacteroidales bacterium]
MHTRLLVLTLLLCGCIFVQAQDSVVTDGFVTFRYPSGAKSSEGTLVNGQPDGWWRSFDEEGNLLSEGNRKDFLLDSVWTFYQKGKRYLTLHYKAGKKEGEQVQYGDQDYTVTHWHTDTIMGDVHTYDNAGWLKSLVPYENGKPHGLAKEFDKTGLVVAVTKYYHGVRNRTERINRTDQFGHKQGSWKYFWENGNLRMEGSYLNDKKHGFFKYYDQNGNFLRVEKYTHDQLDEDAKETKILDQRIARHPNGRPSIIATYHNDKPDGIRREFDTAGNVIKGYLFEEGWLRFEGITDLNGLRQGLWKEYYPTGELRSRGKYKNSHPIGEWYFYFPDKTIEIAGAYNSKGQKHGEWVWFYPTGDTMTVCHYEDGDLDGIYVEYDEAGEIVTRGNYVAGYEEGNWYYRNGTSVESGQYDGGKRTGTWTTTYDKDRIASRIQYNQDVRDGKFTTYWENGNIKTSGKYVNGLQEGAWIQYNEEGIQLLTTLFKEGRELKWNNYTIKD